MRLWGALRSVPVAVMAVVVVLVAVGAVALMAEMTRPEVTVVTDGTDVGRVPGAVGRPLPGSVDNSSYPGPVPGAVVDLSPVATVGGTVTLSGRVEVDGRPLEGANVELARWVGDRSARVVLTADADGAFVGEGLMGGLWTITAWKQPEHRRAEVQRVFMSDGQSASITIRPPLLDRIKLEVAVGPPTDDGQVAVTVVVDTQRVDADGEVIGAGANTLATMVYPQGRQGPADVAVTDGLGTFVVVCAAPAPGGRITVTADEQSKQADLPGCERRAPNRPTASTVPTPTTTVAPVPPPEPGRR
jgi:hypothetical protein